jgi:microcystin-dependent protein
MSQPFIGEIRIFAGSFAPANWAFCDGQALAISQNDALFSLLGTTYGGDGVNTFNLPDLRGRLPLHQGTDGGSSYVLGQNGGVESVTLSTQQIPAHTHPFAVVGSRSGEHSSPDGNLPAQSLNVTPYINDVPSGGFVSAAIGQTGGSQPHENLQPFLCVSFIIALFGVFPSSS